MMPCIELRSVRRRYVIGDTGYDALAGVSLTIMQGEFVSIMGPSGSGKTTLMNIMGCLDVPTGGDFRFLGKSVLTHSRADLARLRGGHIGFVFQSFHLLPRTTAYENVEMPLMYNRSVSGSYAEARVRRALQLVGLENRMHHKPSQLSGGQQQRVAIARALVNDPEIILADEPTGNLDTRTSIEIMELLVELNRVGRTVVLVTHEPDISRYTRRRIVLRDGEVIADRVESGEREY